MNSFLNLLLALAILLAGSCTGDTNGTQNGTDTPADTTAVDTTSPPVGTVTRPDCQLAGNVMPENTFWADNENLLVAISAEEETKDAQFGDSHRVLTVYDGVTCQQVFRQVLPVNLSPDFPYFLSDITYNNVSKVVAIRGFDKVWLFDLANRNLIGPMVPKFLNQRYLDDAQSGMIKRLEVWERFMVGFAASMGAFVFDLSNPAQPQPVLPAAEYEVEKGTTYNSLFLLKSMDEDDGYQAFLPKYDPEAEKFRINPLFEKPRKMEAKLNPKFRNNRYLVLKEFTGANESKPIAIDMGEMKLVDLPPDIAAKKDTEIIEWMKKQ